MVELFLDPGLFFIIEFLFAQLWLLYSYSKLYHLHEKSSVWLLNSHLKNNRDPSLRLLHSNYEHD